MGTEKSSYTPASMYVQVQGGGYTDNYVGTYSEATSSSGVPFEFTTPGTINLRMIQIYYGTYYFSDYMSFNVVEAGPSIIPGTYTDLQQLINNSADTLDLPYNFTFNPEYDDAEVFSNGVLVEKDITIEGNGYTISGNNSNKIFDIYKHNVVLNNVTLVNGNSNLGGALQVSGSANLTMTNSVIKDCVATGEGGAIQVMSGSVTVEGTSFINNTAPSGSAVYYNTASTLTVDDCDFISNKVTGTSTGSGGAITMVSGNLDVTDSTFSDNTALRGAAITLMNFAKELTVSGSEFINNSANDGGAIYVNVASTVSLTGSNFTENKASNQAGAVYLQNKNINAQIDDVNFTGNTAKEGAAITSKLATLNINNSEFADNTATGNGGAVFASGKVTISDSTLMNNKGKELANQIYQTSEGVVTLQNNEIGIIEPSLNVGEVYSLGDEVVADGEFDAGIYNQALTLTYTLNNEEKTTTINKNKKAFTINLGTELNGGVHTIAIKGCVRFGTDV